MEEKPAIPPKKDETLNGMIIIGVIIALIIGFMYLLSVQKTASKCTPQYNPDGTLMTGCGGEEYMVTPTPEGPVKLIEGLNPTDTVDETLRDAAQELQQNMQKQQQAQPPQQQQQQSQQQNPAQQQQIPALPQ